MRTPISLRNLEERLREIQNLKNAFDLWKEHVVITDENANILYANKAVEQNTGYAEWEIIGKNPADLWGGNMPKELYEKMWHTIKDEKKPFVAEVHNKRKDGTKYWQELHISPVLDEHNEIKFFIGIEPNITDEKKRKEFKDEFIGAIGHQLRNPLAAINWVIEGILGGSVLNKDTREKLESLYQEGQTLSDLVRDLLILARTEKEPLQIEIIRVDEEIERLIRAVQQKYPHLSITLHNKTGAIPLDAIRSLALQVFSNLIYNAAEYSDKEQGKVDITLAEDDGLIRFSVKNNGEPIPVGIQEHLFGRVPSKTGEGMGLMVTKIICDFFRWQISYESKEDGTTFTVEIPWHYGGSH